MNERKRRLRAEPRPGTSMDLLILSYIPLLSYRLWGLTVFFDFASLSFLPETIFAIQDAFLS